jgi:predicted RNA-binding protein YlxR (DUF448 family)
VSGEVQPKSGLIRFVAGPDQQLVPDLLGKLPGRGVYVAADADMLQTALRKKSFARGLKQQVTVPDGMAATIERGLARRVIDLLSMARKSGHAVAGYEKVKDWLDKEKALILLQAVDGSGRGKSKLSTPHRGVYIDCLTADELGMAFARQTVIHAAVSSGGLAQRVVEEARRLQGVRQTDGGKGRLEG